ncbi:MAG: hypothetical protein BGO10_01410 [Chlamydia sp. 32-24]|nr:MAG: hypothetical protein BGO10_01410 [Chlamydia sp. 32-24]
MPEAGFVEVDGFKLRYRIEGEGQTALIVGSAIYYQRSFSKQLREHLRLIFVDWRGFGEMMNSPSGSSLSLDTFIDDIEQVRKKLNIESLIMVGHSAHALLALEYAKKYPKYVSHVVMIGISPNLSPEMAQAAERNWQESVWPERKEVLQARIKELPDEELQKLAPAERFVAWCIRRAPQTWYDYHFNSSSLWEGIIPNLSMLDYFYGVALRDLDITKGLENFNKPVLLALGRFDFILAPASVWDPIRSKFQNLTVRIFEHSGHSPHYEEASLFENELLQWIEKKDG